MSKEDNLKKSNQEKRESVDEKFEALSHVEDHFLKCSFADGNQWTVGEVKEIFCESAKDQNISMPLRIQFLDPSKKYSLKVLNVEKLNKKQFILSVTGYKAGAFREIPFMISNQNQKYVIKNLSWKIQSVLKNGGLGVEMVPPFGPWNVSPSYWYLGLWFSLILSSLVFCLFLLKRYLLFKKIGKRIFERLKKQTPLQYFMQQTRKYFLSLHKFYNKEEFLKNLDKILCEYLENRFLIDIESSQKNALRKISKLDISRDKIKKLKILYKEVKTLSQEIEKDIDSYEEKDLNQLMDSIRKWVFSYEEKIRKEE